MAKKEVVYTGLPLDTIIEVIAIKKDEIHIAEMTIEQFQNIKKKPDFQYLPYQKGFSQFENYQNQMSKKLTDQNRYDIAHSEQPYTALCKIYQISKKTVTSIKREFGTNKLKGGKTHAKLTDEQRQYVIDSKENGSILSKELGISTSGISAIRRKAGLSAKIIKLTDEQRKEIAFSTDSYEKIGKLYGTSKHTVVIIKNEFGTTKGRGRGIRTSGFKVSDEDKKWIVESNLPYDVIGLKFNIHESTVGKIKRKAGIFVKRINHNPKTIFTDAMIERLRDATISGRKLSLEIGISSDRISRKRAELGINYAEWKLSNPSPKKQREYIPRPKKPKKPKVNERGKIELEIKVVKNHIPDISNMVKTKSLKKEVSPIKESYYTYEQKQLALAKKAKDNYQSIVERQKLEGYRFVNRICERGIKSRVWTNKQN